MTSRHWIALKQFLAPQTIGFIVYIASIVIVFGIAIGPTLA